MISSCEKCNIILGQIPYLFLDIYNIQTGQIQYPVKTNAISSIDKYNIEIFSDLICAVHLDTSRQFVASNFGKPLVVRIHGAWIFLDPICAVHLEMSRQFVASISWYTTCGTNTW